MSNRLPVLPDLASLAKPQAAPDGAARPGGYQETLYRFLRPAILRVRRQTPQEFYPVRTVARAMGVSLWTVAAVYRRLEREGLLACVRGSHTLVVPRRRPSAVVKVRGVVVVLIWTPGFTTTYDRRHFFIGIENRLRQLNYVADLVFYREEDKGALDIANRVLAHHPTGVLWFCPNSADQMTLDRIGDAGVPLVTIADVPVKTRSGQYILDWSRGLETALQAWRKAGLTRVVVPLTPKMRLSLTHVLPALARKAGLEVVYRPPGRQSTGDYFAGLMADERAGVFFDDDLWQSRLCLRAPEDIAGLIARRRTMTCRSLPISPTLLVNRRLDALQMPWDALAQRVADDLRTGEFFTMAEDVRFAAKWRPNVPATQVARAFAYE